MLHQLNILRKEMYRGYYTLDTFRFRAHDVKKEKDHGVSYSFILSKFNHAKRVCFRSDSDERVKELKVVVSLETIIGDANEFIKLSSTYPCLSRQPHSMYLLLDKCMFGRQMEMECVINFLLHGEITYGADHLGVLPIIGPGKVGKSTLVEHACIDERVRSHFSQIVFFSKDGLTHGNIVTLKDCGTTKHQTDDALGGSKRRLVVVELDGEIDQGLWERFYSASKSCFAYGNPTENPKLASLVMDMASERNCNEAHNYSGLITASSPSAASQITVQDIMFGTATPLGQFKVLAWRSHIPPYYSCVFDCEIKRPPTRMVSRKKKTKKIGI
ncbi:uncharacterized protein [Oryza sativa Japonica Group]|uniref:uncharacterized protein n=1 Tax=Oryza sativa subsp. japonica TaxID=39947 RepID=UPI0007754F5C|nr:uncharacterized protein LOC107278143 [Oryza sativa Japonica Group]